MSFSDLGLAEPLLRAISDQGYKTPTPIQAQAIPMVLKGKDLLASAQTGTGKTAAFVLPLLHNLFLQKARAMSNHALILIVTPTRELAAQIQENIVQCTKYLQIRSTAVFGGVKINPQLMAMRSGVEILVATPGRLMDLHQQNAIQFSSVQTVVLDEADRMLDMGFIHDIKRILSKLPKKRQSLLFSATFSNEVRKLAKELLVQPVEIDVAPRNAAATSVKQLIHPVDKGQKADLLRHLIIEKGWHQALVFSRTKHGANKLVKLLLKDNIDAMAIHGNKSQAQRTKALSDFKAGKLQILVATDIAARGLDIEELPLVVNFELPQVPQDYVHRIGRTGRAGAGGQAISLVCADEIDQLKDIEKLLNRSIERVTIDDFEPSHQVPISSNLAGASRHTSKSASKPISRTISRTGSKPPSNKNFKRSHDNRKATSHA